MPGCTREILTDSLEEPLGLVFPRDPKEVDRQATENYDKANATLHRGLPEGDGDQEQAGQDEEHREYQVHLGTEGGAVDIGSEAAEQSTSLAPFPHLPHPDTSPVPLKVLCPTTLRPSLEPSSPSGAPSLSHGTPKAYPASLALSLFLPAGLRWLGLPGPSHVPIHLF